MTQSPDQPDDTSDRLYTPEELRAFAAAEAPDGEAPDGAAPAPSAPPPGTPPPVARPALGPAG